MEHPAISTSDFRMVMGEFPTGVAVVCTGTADRVHAMTANAISSVSLSPPLLLFCVSRQAVMAEKLAANQQFTVNILPENESALSDYFAGRRFAESSPTFEFVDWLDGARLENASAAIHCCLYALHDGGDHWIALGRPRAIHLASSVRPPLIFHRGRYLHQPRTVPSV